MPLFRRSPRLPDFDHFTRALLTHLLDTDPRRWRLRQVHRITPVNPDAYRERVSYQFRISRDLVRAACVRHEIRADFVDSHDEIEAILPLDDLRKYALLEFSIEGPDGKPLTLLHSEEINRLTFVVLQDALQSLDARCGDGLRSAHDFVVAQAGILRALVSSGQHEAQRLAQAAGLPQPIDIALHEYVSGMVAFYERVLTPVLGDAARARGASEACRDGLRALCALIADLDREVREELGGGEGMHSPLLNPGLLLAEHFRARLPGPGPEDLDPPGFLAACGGYVRAIGGLEGDELRFWNVIDVLKRLTENYVAYARVRIPLDRDFLVKMEQLVPIVVEPWRERWRKPPLLQRYPIGVNASRSTHIEVVCEHPIELEQVPNRTRIRIPGRSLPLETLFGRTEQSGRYHQHFYTGQPPDAIERRFQQYVPPSSTTKPYRLPPLALEVLYQIEGVTKWAYRGAVTIACVALVVFLKEFNPTDPQARLASAIPLLTGLFGVLASLRPQENIVVIATRRHKYSVLLIAGAMVLYLIIGFFRPDWVVALRSFFDWKP